MFLSTLKSYKLLYNTSYETCVNARYDGHHYMYMSYETRVYARYDGHHYMYTSYEICVNAQYDGLWQHKQNFRFGFVNKALCEGIKRHMGPQHFNIILLQYSPHAILSHLWPIYNHLLNNCMVICVSYPR